MATRTFAARLALLSLGLAAGAPAAAADFNLIGSLNQAEFRAFSEDVGAAAAYKGLVPAEGLGITGFDIGLSASATQLTRRDVLRKAAGGASVPEALPVTSLRVHKGLPWDIDIGAALTQLPGTNVRATGGELRWAFVGGGTLWPAVAARLSGSRVNGVEGLKMDTVGAELLISKGVLIFTPYAGIGQVRIRADAPGSSLRRESLTLDRRFVGVNIALLPLALVLEGERIGEAESYSIKAALRF
jgi:hypothetical protein